MAILNSPVILSTFLMEPNRRNGKGPTLLVSEWIEYIAEAGYRSVEIWAPHILLTTRSEWEAIREKSLEFELPIASILVQIPTDASQKSHKYRESIIEATTYFECLDIRFTLPTTGTLKEKQEVVGHWAQDLSRECHLIRSFDTWPEKNEMNAWRDVLEGRFRVSVNPLAFAVDKWEPLFQDAGDDLVNIGLQPPEDIIPQPIKKMEHLRKLIVCLRDMNFRGSWTLDSTGVGVKGESVDDLFDAAEEDLNFLVGALAKK